MKYTTAEGPTMQYNLSIVDILLLYYHKVAVINQIHQIWTNVGFCKVKYSVRIHKNSIFKHKYLFDPNSIKIWSQNVYNDFV